MNNSGYVYQVNLVVDVKRIDGAVLNEHEDDMVKEMQSAAEKAIAEIMQKHGMNNRKHLGKEVKKY